MKKNKKILSLKKRSKTYVYTLIKGYGTRDFIEILTGFCEDLLYRTGSDLDFKPSMWHTMVNYDRDSITRSFVDSNGIRHNIKDFSLVGDGDPYSTVDLILIEASAFGLRDKVDQMAKTYMLQGLPIVDAYEIAYEYWTDFDS